MPIASRDLDPNLRLLAAFELKGCDPGRLRAIQAALDAGANPNQLHNGQRALLALAASAGDLGAAKLLLDAKADPDWPHGAEGHPLCMAAQDNRPAMISYLLSRGADPHLPDLYGWSPLLHATRHPEAVAALLAGGADPSRPGHPRHQVTALMACMRDRGERANAKLLQSARLLLDAGASLEFSNPKSGTAGDIAASSGNQAAIDFIAQARAERERALLHQSTPADTVKKPASRI